MCDGCPAASGAVAGHTGDRSVLAFIHPRDEGVDVTERAPTKVENLDRYGTDPLDWTRARDGLAAGPGVSFLSTTRPDGRPHAASVGAVWIDGDLYFTSNAETQKSRNLAANPAAAFAVQIEGMDLILNGTVERVTDPATLETVAAAYRNGGWPAEVEGDAFTAPFSAPSAGPPPWNLYRFTYDSVVGVGTTEPFGATRWRFS